MKTIYFLTYKNIVSSVGVLPISGFALPEADLRYLKFKRLSYFELKRLIENPFIKNQ